MRNLAHQKAKIICDILLRYIKLIQLLIQNYVEYCAGDYSLCKYERLAKKLHLLCMQYVYIEKFIIGYLSGATTIIEQNKRKVCSWLVLIVARHAVTLVNSKWSTESDWNRPHLLVWIFACKFAIKSWFCSSVFMNIRRKISTFE